MSEMPLISLKSLDERIKRLADMLQETDDPLDRDRIIGRMGQLISARAIANWMGPQVGGWLRITTREYDREDDDECDDL